MKIMPGTFLQSSVSLNDPEFDSVTIFLTEFNSNGATGFIVNKRHDRLLNELQEFSAGRAFPLHAGGPVNNDQLYFVHNKPQLINDGIQIIPDVFLGGNFSQALQVINSQHIGERDIKLFIGYCGWDPGQLEQEIEEGSWKIVENEPATVF